MPAKPTPASTVILVRQHDGELQVYLLRRSAESGFMAGHYVFPGGTVEDEDRDLIWENHADMDLGKISERLGGDLTGEEALAYSVTAIRELFEEAGVLLAHRAEQSESDFLKASEMRAMEGLAKGWLREKAESEGWSLQLSMLRRWSHWITPEPIPQRYDTRFFLSFMPAGQECVPDSRETTHGIWIHPMDALIRNAEGELPLSPPTVTTLQEFLDDSDVMEVEKGPERRQWGKARCPRLVRSPKGLIMLLPWDPMFDQAPSIDTRGLENKILPPGEPFSRVWQCQGIWRPVGT